MTNDRLDALKKCISEKEAAKRDYDDYAFEPYIPCFQGWLADRLEAEAERLSKKGQPLSEYRKELEDWIESLIEEIMPDRELAVALEIFGPPSRREIYGGFPGTEVRFATVSRQDGLEVRVPPSDSHRAIYGRHGLWEGLVVDGQVHSLREGVCSNSLRVREHLREAGLNRLIPLLARHVRRTGLDPRTAHSLPSAAQRPKTGPKRDFESARRVAEIVAEMAPDGDWRSKYFDVLEALDEGGVPVPPRWRKRSQDRPAWASWADCDDRAVGMKAIQYRLDAARRLAQDLP